MVRADISPAQIGGKIRLIIAEFASGCSSACTALALSLLFLI
jgi:hypothetical protein